MNSRPNILVIQADQLAARYLGAEFSAVDPEQLFDLEQDPHEQTNLIANPDYQVAYQALSQLVQQQWDIETLTQQVLASQRRWLFLREALAKGKHADWDFNPPDELEQHRQRADKVYSQWAYQDILGYRVPQK